ncbi:MAG: CvpA family protein [Candidatus Excrementavichristensenella sp.]|mgnify:CR=1 FL=1|jgi:uncharacterized membrane protein required for colicin V production|nr:CvpA family protein [Bacillota bacterium]NLL54180.1 CvpA family protein [Clostridiales bacterium]
MNLNIVDFVILTVLGLSLVAGMYKGLLASGLTTLGFGAAFFGAQRLYPQLSKAIQSNTSLMKVLEYYLDASSMFKNVTLAEQSVVGATQNGLLAQAVGELSSLPRTIVSAFQSNVDKQVFSALGFDTMAEYLNQTIWSAIINVASFLILFVVAFFLVTLLVNLLNNVFHFPVLKHFDWLLGGAFGLVRGIVIVSLILAVVPLITSMLNVQVIQDTLNASALMGYFPSDFAIADIIARSFA